jgi:TolA-binding protein
VLAGQAFILAEKFTQAVKVLTATFSNPEVDKDSAAEAMYWCGHAYVELSDFPEAYRVLKRLTWDFPATKWAKFARGRLTEENLADAEPE